MQTPNQSREWATFLGLSIAAIIVASGDLSSSELTLTRIAPSRVDAEYSHPGWHGHFPRTEFLIASVYSVDVDPTTHEITVLAGEYDGHSTHGSGPPGAEERIREFFLFSTAGQKLRIPIFRIPVTLIIFGICAFLCYVAAVLSYRKRRLQNGNGLPTSLRCTTQTQAPAEVAPSMRT